MLLATKLFLVVSLPRSHSNRPLATADGKAPGQLARQDDPYHAYYLVRTSALSGPPIRSIHRGLPVRTLRPRRGPGDASCNRGPDYAECRHYWIGSEQTSWLMAPVGGFSIDLQSRRPSYPFPQRLAVPGRPTAGNLKYRRSSPRWCGESCRIPHAARLAHVRDSSGRTAPSSLPSLTHLAVAVASSDPIPHTRPGRLGPCLHPCGPRRPPRLRAGPSRAPDLPTIRSPAPQASSPESTSATMASSPPPSPPSPFMTKTPPRGTSPSIRPWGQAGTTENG